MRRSLEDPEEIMVYTLVELCEACRVEQNFVLDLVSHGIIEPQDEHQKTWQFTSAEVFRARRARRLYRDLDLNLEGVALALELMDQNRRLKERVRFLEQLMYKLQQ